MTLATGLTRDAGCSIPVICGAMYPCSNPELVAAASDAGAIGIVQPISMTYVHGYALRDGLALIRRLTSKSVGMNALIEDSSKVYRRRMEKWIDLALAEGVRFFVTSLGKPSWVVDRVHAVGGKVYHDVTERRWALKGMESGVDGFIAVNARAGGHAGTRSAAELFDEIADLDLPVVCAGGIATPSDFVAALRMGYAGVQMGTRFIATTECTASDAYRRAIVEAREEDIVHTERLTGVPVAVIENDHVRRVGTRAGPIARRMLRWRRTKKLMRTLYGLRSIRRLGRDSLEEDRKSEYWQAGKSVAGIDEVQPVGSILAAFREAANLALKGG